jgi:hypothetical protein
MYVLSFQNSKALQQKNLISEVRQRGGGNISLDHSLDFVKGKPLNNLLGLTPHTKMKCYNKRTIYII